MQYISETPVKCDIELFFSAVAAINLRTVELHKMAETASATLSLYTNFKAK